MNIFRYVTPKQAQELALMDSVPRVHGQLKDLESWGFIKRISTYPALKTLTGGTRSGTPRFRRKVSTSSAAARGYVSTLQS